MNNIDEKTIKIKQCLICERDYKPTNNRQKYCLDCRDKVRQEQWEAYKQTDEFKASQKRYKDEFYARPEVKEEAREYYKKHKERMKAQATEWQKEHKKEHAEGMKKYQQTEKGKEKGREASQRYRDKQKKKDDEDE